MPLSNLLGMASSGSGGSTPGKAAVGAGATPQKSKAASADNIRVTCRFRPLNKKELKLSAKTCVYMPKGNTQQVILNVRNRFYFANFRTV